MAKLYRRFAAAFALLRIPCQGLACTLAWDLKGCNGELASSVEGSVGCGMNTPPPPPNLEHHYHHTAPPEVVYVERPKKKWSKWKITGIVVAGLWVIGTIGNALEESKSNRLAEEKAAAISAMTPEKRAESERQKKVAADAAALKQILESELHEKAMAEKVAAEAQREADKRKPLANYSGIEITSIYHENEVAADNALKGRFVQVTGKVTDIKKDFMDNVYIVMKGERGRWSLNNVHITLDDPSIAGSIRKNRRYGFVCKVNGLIMGSVMLKECRIQ